MFNLITNEEFLEKVDKYNLENPKKKRIYGLSIIYYLKAFILVILIFLLNVLVFSNLFYLDKKTAYDYIVLFFEICLFIYIIYYIQKIFMYRIVVNSNEIRQNNNKIIISDIKELSLVLIKIRNKGFERALSIKTNDQKEYIFRLNIYNSVCFIKQISVLSGKKIKLEVKK